MVGAAGMAILFFMYLLAATILGVLAGFTAHSFLTVVEDTAAGNDEVRWPNDPLVDWAWKFVYLGWLMAAWLVPAMIVARLWAAGSPPETAFAKTAGMVAVLFWLFFPISLLSSLSASSRWFIFSPAILPRFAQRSGAAAMFYLVTAQIDAGRHGAAGFADRADLPAAVRGDRADVRRLAVRETVRPAGADPAPHARPADPAGAAPRPAAR